MKSVGNIASDSEVVATADGAITAGKPVVVNADGTVKFAGSFSVNNTEAVTTAFAEVRSGHDVAGGQSVIYDTNAQRFVLNFQDGDNSNYGTSIVIEIDSSDFSLSYGTPVVFHSAASQSFQSCFDSNNNKVVIVYKGNSDSDGRAIVGTVDNSDNSISFGTVAKFNSTNNCTEPHTCFDSTNNKVIVTWQNNSNSSYGTAAVGTVSGTDISFGTAAVFESASTTAPKPVHDVGANKIVIQYVDVGNSYYGTGIVGTVSGTDISFGSAVVYNSSTEYGIGQPVYDSTNNKTVFIYQDYGDTEKGKARVVSISGTTPSYGTEVTFESQKVNPLSATFDSNIGKVAIGYYDETPTNMRHITGTVSGTDISFGSELDITSDNGQPSAGAAAFDPNTGKVLYVARNVADSDKPYATVVQVGGTSTTTPLTSENFIGFAKDAVADGAVATIQTANSIARDNIQDTTTSDTLGSEVALGQNIAAEDSTSMVFDSSNNKVVVFYVNSSSGESTTVVGTVSDNSISFGTPATFTDAQYSVNAVSCVFDSNENKVVFAYVDTMDSNQGKAVVGTVSGTSISFGSEVEFESGRPYTLRGTFDSNSNRVVFVYRDSNNSNYFTSVVGSVSGTSISFGTPVVIVSAYYNYWDITFDSNSNKVVVGLKGASSHGQSYVGTVDSSDNSISWGSVATFHSSANPRYIGATFDTNANKVVFSYMADDDSDKGYAVVGTVSGTDISFGTPAKFEDAAVKYTSIVFNSATNKVVVVYEDDANSDYTTYAVGTVSGTDISFATPVVVSENDANENTSIVFDSNSNKVVMQYGHSSDAKFRVLDVAGADTDLTIGQQYFVQTDGTLSTSADDPSVIAGTAISGTDLIVKG